VSPSNRYFSPNLSQLRTSKKFATASRSCCQENSSSAAIELVDTYNESTSRGCLVQVGQLLGLPFNSIRPTAIRGFVVYTTGIYGGQDFDWQRGSRASCFRELLRSEGWTFLRHTVDSERCSSVDERSTLASVFVSAEASSWLEQSRKEETISQWELVHLMTTGQSRRSAPVHAAMDLDCTVPDLPHERAYTSHHAQHRTNLAQSSKNRTPEAQTKLH